MHRQGWPVCDKGSQGKELEGSLDLLPLGKYDGGFNAHAQTGVACLWCRPSKVTGLCQPALPYPPFKR